MEGEEKPEQEISNTIIIDKIYRIRGKRVMIDRDLAELYEVETKVLNQAVRRNMERFPEDFMFQLTENEYEILRSQFVTSSGHGGRRYRPKAFTEQGVAMLSSVLRSPRAIQVNIHIMRVYMELREMLLSQKDVIHHLEQLESRVNLHDEDLKNVMGYLESLLTEKEEQESRKRIGYKRAKEED